MLRCFSSCRRLSRDSFALGQRPSNDSCAAGKAGHGGGSSQEPSSITRSKQPPLTHVDLRSLPQGRFALITGLPHDCEVRALSMGRVQECTISPECIDGLVREGHPMSVPLTEKALMQTAIAQQHTAPEWCFIECFIRH